MPQKFHDPTLIHDVKGPKRDEFAPDRALAIIHQMVAAEHSEDRRIVREDVAALALIYASHFSALHVPFEVERDSVYLLESEGYITPKWLGVAGVSIEVIAR